MLKASPIHKQRGLSLIELLVAGTLGIFVLVSVLQAFNALQDNNRVVRSVSDLQESGWSAIRLLQRDVHMAAFGGCASGDSASFAMNATGVPVTDLFDDAIRGYTVNGAGRWQTGPTSVVPRDAGASDPVIHSDVITISRASAGKAQLLNTRLMSDLSDPVVASPGGTINFLKDDLVIVSDCAAGDVFRVTNDPDPTTGAVVLAHDNSANNSNDLSRLYDEAAEVRRFTTSTYYVGETGRDDASGNPITALYVVPHGGARQELVQGVETLQILYGEELSNGQIRYSDVRRHDIDWSNVISVRIAMLVSGLDRMLPEDDRNLYSLGGITVGPRGSRTQIQHPGDRKLRRVFSTTIFIQNKMANDSAST